MFEFHIEMNGRSMQSGDFKDAISKAIFEKVTTMVKNTVGSIRCPEHHQAAKIVARGNDLSSLEFNVSACCDKMVEDVRKKIANMR